MRKSSFKICHFTAVRYLYPSIRQQLQYEYRASKDLYPRIDWNIVALHDFQPQSCFEVQTPRALRFHLLRNFYAWILIIKMSRSFDLVVVRHMSFDLFSFVFAPLVKNRISVHHSKEVEELGLIRYGLLGKLASIAEQYFGSNVISLGLGVIGVTNEISEYECGRVKKNLPFAVYPNGIDPTIITLAEDLRVPSVLQLAFVCSYFSPWHGLDLLLDSLESYISSPCSRVIKLHIIGEVAFAELDRIAASDRLSSICNVAGYLDGDQLERLLSCCDAGIGSLALWRKGLREASTLKVREYLARGLPVLSGHQDPSLPGGFPYYDIIDLEQLDQAFNKAFKFKSIPRSLIRSESLEYISKSVALKNLAPWVVGRLGDY